MRQDRFLSGILIGIAALVMLAVALFFVRANTLDYGEEDTPTGVVNNYIIAVKKGDFERAYGYLAEFDGKPELVEFEQTFRQLQSWEVGGAGVEVGAASVSSERTLVVVSMVRGGGGLFNDPYRNQESAELVVEKGAWKIKSMPYPFWNYTWVEGMK
jgi:hypothetical protein